VLDQLGRLTGDLGKLRDDMRLVGRHLSNAQQAFHAAERKIERFEQRLATVAGDGPAAVETSTIAQLELRVPTAS
jgi:DNA anti-recombination protein RmuC